MYLYLQDDVRGTVPFRPDIIVPVDDVFGKKVEALHMMPSQFYEWLPWTMGTLDSVPSCEAERKAWLDCVLREWMKNPYTAEMEVMYGSESAHGIEMVESFQLCEFGRQIDVKELCSMFPDLPERIDF